MFTTKRLSPDIPALDLLGRLKGRRAARLSGTTSQAPILLDQRPLQSARERFRHILGTVDIVSFDIFDTLIVRRVPKPTTIFALMEREWLLPRFAQERVRAETAARKKAWESERRVEITLAEIYAATNFPPLLENALMDAEIESEILHCRRNETAYSFFQEATRSGKRVLLLSDMYLPVHVTKRILAANGIDGYEQLYLSSDRMATKASGDLFDLLLTEIDTEAHRIVHIGDNPSSDIEVARMKGLQTVLFPKISDLRIYDRERGPFMDSLTHTQMIRKLIWHAYAQAVAEGAPGEGKAGFWYSVGFRLLAPGLIGFARMIREGWKRESLDRVFFLARDGAIILDAFKMLYPELTDSCRYLVVSRRMLNIAAMQTLGHKELDFLVSGTSKKTCGEFVARIGVDLQDIPPEVFSQHGLSLDRVIATGEDYRRLRNLLLCIKDAILNVAADERAALTRYFEEVGWGEGTRVGIVDVGWHGTLQRSLDVLIAKGDVGSNLVKGFYFGTYGAASESVPAWSNRVESFMFHYGEPKRCEEAIRSCVEFHELLFSDVSFSALGIGVEDGGIVFKYAHTPAEEARFDIIRALRRGAKDAIRNVGPQLVNSDTGLTALRDYYAVYSTEMLNNPFMVELLNIGDVVHAEGFEHQSYRPLIVAPRSRGRKAYRSARTLSYWKRGYEMLHKRSLRDLL